MNNIKMQETDRKQQSSTGASSATDFSVEVNPLRGGARAALPGTLQRLVGRFVSRIAKNVRHRQRQNAKGMGSVMKKFAPLRPTAEVAGAEFLATAVAKWPAPIQHRGPARYARSGATALTAGIEYRAMAGQYGRSRLVTRDL